MPLPATSKYIGVTALGGHVARALDFQARTDVWVVLGKPTQWTGTDPLNSGAPVSDSAPPTPNPALTAPIEPVVVKKAVLNLVVPDNINGTIFAYGLKWRTVTPQDAVTESARHVMVTSSFDYNEAPIREVDSFLLADAAQGATTLSVKDANGYLVGDYVKCGGIDGLETTVTAVNTTTDVITIADPLPSILYAGTYITAMSHPTAWRYRSVAVLSHVVATLGAPGQQVIPFERVTSSMLEYLYNTEPIPRQLNRRDGVVLILTF